MPNCLDRFTAFLEQSERSPFTIRNYRCDLDAFAAWFERANGDPLDPAKITPTDLRGYKRLLLVKQALKPNSINRKLATLKSFLKWANEAGLLTHAATLRMPKAEREERHGPRWLDRREQHALRRAAEGGKNTERPGASRRVNWRGRVKVLTPNRKSTHDRTRRVEADMGKIPGEVLQELRNNLARLRPRDAERRKLVQRTAFLYNCSEKSVYWQLTQLKVPMMTTLRGSKTFRGVPRCGDSCDQGPPEKSPLTKRESMNRMANTILTSAISAVVTIYLKKTEDFC